MSRRPPSPSDPFYKQLTQLDLTSEQLQQSRSPSADQQPSDQPQYPAPAPASASASQPLPTSSHAYRYRQPSQPQWRSQSSTSPQVAPQWDTRYDNQYYDQGQYINQPSRSRIATESSSHYDEGAFENQYLPQASTSPGPVTSRSHGYTRPPPQTQYANQASVSLGTAASSSRTYTRQPPQGPYAGQASASIGTTVLSSRNYTRPPPQDPYVGQASASRGAAVWRSDGGSQYQAPNKTSSSRDAAVWRSDGGSQYQASSQASSSRDAAAWRSDDNQQYQASIQASEPQYTAISSSYDDNYRQSDQRQYVDEASTSKGKGKQREQQEQQPGPSISSAPEPRAPWVELTNEMKNLMCNRVVAKKADFEYNLHVVATEGEGVGYLRIGSGREIKMIVRKDSTATVCGRQIKELLRPWTRKQRDLVNYGLFGQPSGVEITFNWAHLTLQLRNHLYTLNKKQGITSVNGALRDYADYGLDLAWLDYKFESEKLPVEPKIIFRGDSDHKVLGLPLSELMKIPWQNPKGSQKEAPKGKGKGKRS